MASDDFKLAIRGKLEAFHKDHMKALEKIHTEIPRKAGRRTRRGIRRQIQRKLNTGKRAGGAPLEDTIIYKDTPKKGYAHNASTQVRSVAKYNKGKNRTKSFDLIMELSRNVTVTAQRGKWLALPTDDAPLRSGRGGSRTATPDELIAAGVRPVFLQTGPREAVLVSPDKSQVWYTLKMRTSRKKILDPDQFHRKSVAKMPQDHETAFRREHTALEAKYGRGL